MLRPLIIKWVKIRFNQSRREPSGGSGTRGRDSFQKGLKNIRYSVTLSKDLSLCGFSGLRGRKLCVVWVRLSSPNFKRSVGPPTLVSVRGTTGYGERLVPPRSQVIPSGPRRGPRRFEGRVRSRSRRKLC